MKRKVKVLIVIPAYNEASVIGRTVKDAKKVFADQPYATKIVVINDKSQDDTAKKARKAGAIVISHIINQGVGGATSTGLSYARKDNADYVITIDADGQHDTKDALACLKQSISTNADLMIGSRLLTKKGMSKTKIIGNKGLTLITWLLFGVNITDSQSGLRVFSKTALDTLEWKSTSYDFCSEMIWRAKQAKLNIAEYPIKAIYTDYSKAKGQSNWNAINIVRSLIYRKVVEFLG